MKVFFQGKEIICPLEKTFDNEVGQLKVQRQGKKTKSYFSSYHDNIETSGRIICPLLQKVLFWSSLKIFRDIGTIGIYSAGWILYSYIGCTIHFQLQIHLHIIQPMLQIPIVPISLIIFYDDQKRTFCRSGQIIIPDVSILS